MKNIIQIICLFALAVLSSQCSYESDLTSPTDTGVAGSLAAMSIVGDYLYLVDNQSLKTFSLTNPRIPSRVGEDIELDFGVETIFSRGELLFIGSRTGMYIYNIQNPANPVRLAEHTHFFGCDPVVANDSIAFVTVRSAEGCRTFFPTNQLEIVDVSDPVQPFTIDIIELNNPAGLGLDGQHLFVTDGDDGIKIFDVSDPLDVTYINIIPISSFDVIPLNGLLIVVTEDRIYQYDYTDINNIVELSVLEF